MITRARVQAIEGNRFRVYIPLFHGNEANLNRITNNGSNYTSLPLATLCTLPGVDNVVNEGDIVFVAFEQNDLAYPVILGHLYLTKDAERRCDTCVDLEVRALDARATASEVRLPENTKLAYKSNMGTVQEVSADEIGQMLAWSRLPIFDQFINPSNNGQ